MDRRKKKSILCKNLCGELSMEKKELKDMIPCIKKDPNGIPTLYINESPHLMLGGELHNSSSSSLEYMEKEVWPYLRQFSMNTVLLPIAWENVEEVRGNFDFTLLRGIIKQARREKKKIVLLWFGLWKNGESFYVPAWMKEDYKKFFRSCYVTGAPSDTISPFCEAAVDADKNAFCQLMKYLYEFDRDEQTVIMVQVENEIGFLGAERDFSTQAECKFYEQIPSVMESFIDEKNRKNINWESAFGEDASEMFMAHYYAKAVEKIAAAGKHIYPLPMYANAWLKQHPERPGIYPSGGPVSSMLPIWKAVAPSLDFIAPDIYVPDFKRICEEYTRYDNALFIPEARRDPVTASNVFWAIGGGNALGFSPFAIEDFMREECVIADETQLNALNIESAAFNCNGTGPFLKRSYEILSGILPQVLERRGTNRIKAFIQSNPNERGTIIPMENYDIRLDYTNGKSGSAGLILEEKNGFFISGSNAKFQILPKTGSRQFLTVVRMEEGIFQDGVWKKGRILNGDELHDQKLGDMAETKYIRICLHNV